MLVIEGKNQKSLYIRDYLLENVDRSDNNDTCLIDYIGVPHLFSGLASHYCQSGDDMTALTSVDDFIKWNESFETYKRIIFYVNAPIEMLEQFKHIEDTYKKEIVVTIQTDDEEIKAWGL